MNYDNVRRHLYQSQSDRMTLELVKYDGYKTAR